MTGWLDTLADLGCDLRARCWEKEGYIGVSGEDADTAGSGALRLLATERGKPVRVFGPSEHHSGKTFKPQ